MTCVWEGISDKLHLHMKPSKLLSYIKHNNVITSDVLCNGVVLSELQLHENFNRIKNLDKKKIGHGYDCSACDPLLCLICKLYKVTIVHDFCGNIIKYTITGNDKHHNKTIKFYSNSGHFW